jgi:hypothetical protein
MVVMGEVKGGHVVYAYDADKGDVVREKDANAKK